MAGAVGSWSTCSPLHPNQMPPCSRNAARTPTAKPPSAPDFERVGGATRFETTTRRLKTLPPKALRDAAQRLSSPRSEEHTSELQSLMRISYAGLRFKKTQTI